MITYQDHKERASAICDRIAEKVNKNESIDILKLVESMDNIPVSEFYTAYDIVREFCSALDIDIGSTAPVVAPPIGLATVDVTLARVRMKFVMENFLRQVESHHKNKLNIDWLNALNDKNYNLHAAMKVAVGIGKTKTAQDCIADYIKNAQQANIPHRVLWLVPTHKLSKDTCDDFINLGVSVEVWRGRDAADPNNAPNTMCLKGEDCKEASKAGADPDQVVCGSKKLGFCPFFNTCGYRAQKVSCANADVVIAAHNFIFMALNKDITKDVGIVVIDESFWQKSEPVSRDIVISSLASDVKNQPVVDKKGELLIQENKELYDLSEDLESITLGLQVGEYVSDLHLSGFNKDAVVRAIKNEWKRKLEVVMYPGMTLDDRKAERQRVQCNASINRRISMWHVILGLLENSPGYEGRLQRSVRAIDGGTVQTLILRTHKRVIESVEQLPVLILDATCPERIVSEFFHRVVTLSNVRAKTPAMTITQVLGMIDATTGLPRGGFGKTSLDYSQANVPVHQLEKRLRKCDAIKTLVKREVGCGTGLVVCNEVIEPHFQHIAGVQTAHFNNVVGLDGYKDVDCIFVIGRPLPNSNALHEMARCIFGYIIPESKSVLETGSILMSTGTGANILRWKYDNEDLEYIKQAITDAEVIQAVGRGRGVIPGRKPLKVFVMGDSVLDMPVDDLCVWKDVKPDCVDQMWNEGIVLQSPTDAALRFPDIFLNVDAAKKLFRKADFTSINGIDIEYQVAGIGAKKRRASAISWMEVAAFKCWLEAQYGPSLVIFKA